MMTSKEKFIQAILLATRLDNKNEYIISAVEILIARLEEKEYSRFLAYLGERKSDYEKPIENVAKGIQEYIDLKELPRVEYAKVKAEEIRQLFNNMKNMFSDHDKWINFLSSKREDKIFREITNAKTGDLIFTDELLDIIFNTGMLKISHQTDRIFVDEEVIGDSRLFERNVTESYVFQYLTKDLSKSISDRILIGADKKQELSLLELKNKAKLMIGKQNEQN